MKTRIIIGIFLGCAALVAGLLFFYKLQPYSVLSPVPKAITTPTPKPLEKYSFENLRNTKFIGNPISIGNVLSSQEKFTSRMFYFSASGATVSGLINIPTASGVYPIVVLIRGFVDLSIYDSGVGTKRDGVALAENGFITLAPDFLGYGQSASPSANPMEERFQTYTTVLNLLASLNYINDAFVNTNATGVTADPTQVGIWGHSNGGHIALSILEITGKPYPTVLWAPVSKPFPFSILYYTDEYEDHGKALRKLIADFESDYDAEKYSLTNYFDWITAPIQLHQGTADDAVPLKWSDTLYGELKKLGGDITYFTYEGADHNLSPTGWTPAMTRTIEFFHKYL